MKRIFLLAICFCTVIFGIQSCKSSTNEKENVQNVTDDFLKSIVNEDYEKAKELGNDKTDGIIEMIKMSSTMIPDSLRMEVDSAREAAKNATISFGATTFNEEGTEATVTFTTSDAPNKEETMHLKKVDDKWLVDMHADMPAE